MKTTSKGTSTKRTSTKRTSTKCNSTKHNSIDYRWSRKNIGKNLPLVAAYLLTVGAVVTAGTLLYRKRSKHYNL